MIISNACPNDLITGVRGDIFQNFIANLFQMSSLPQELIKTILQKDEYMQEFNSCFTHISYYKNSEVEGDLNKNYEYYELLGDITANYCIVKYLDRRFKYLSKTTAGVKVISRLRINLVSKQQFSKMAKDLGFSSFISMDSDAKLKQEHSILEDVFEAFIGLMENILNQEYGGEIGYVFCYNFIERLFNKIDISLNYENLYDPITRLKETCDHFNSSTYKMTCPFIWGTISFSHEKIDSQLYTVRLLQVSSERKEVLAKMEGSSIIEMKHSLCENYLKFLKMKGFQKDPPAYYKEIEDKRLEIEQKK